MKLVTHIILLLMLSFTARSQKVLVIDTVVSKGYESVDLQVDLYCGDSLIDCYLYDSLVEYVPTMSISNGRTYIVRPVPHLNYLSVSIGFDDKQSRLLLLNIDKVKEDTLRISKWGLYKNRLGGYEKGFKAYTKMLNDSFLTSYPYKVEEFIRYDQIKKDTLKEIGFTMNGKDYSLPLRITSFSYRTSFNGCTPIKIYNKFSGYAAKHDEPYKRKFSYDKFHGEAERVDYVYEAVLDLSTAP